jgi:hypothetical protein
MNYNNLEMLQFQIFIIITMEDNKISHYINVLCPCKLCVFLVLREYKQFFQSQNNIMHATIQRCCNFISIINNGLGQYIVPF